MKLRIVHRGKGDLDLGVIYGGIGIFAFIGARFFSELTLLLPPCPFHLLTGLPCPTCGATRSGLLLSQFRLLDAFLTNPLFVLVCAGVAAWAVSAFALHIFGRRVRIRPVARAQSVIRFFLIGTVLVNWVYLIIMRV